MAKQNLIRTSSLCFVFELYQVSWTYRMGDPCGRAEAFPLWTFWQVVGFQQYSDMSLLIFGFPDILTIFIIDI